MSVRTDYIIEDCQKCFHTLISTLTGSTSPWTRWTAVLGYPETDMFTDFKKPLIYTMSPMQVDKQWQQGGLCIGFYEYIQGLWDDRKTGGVEEINIMSSNVLSLFQNPQSVGTTTFDITLDEAYEDTTLMAQGISVMNIIGPREIATENPKEFRREFSVLFRA